MHTSPTAVHAPTDKWFNHAIFYLASSLYHIEFFIVGFMPTPTNCTSAHNHIHCTDEGGSMASPTTALLLTPDNFQAALRAIHSLQRSQQQQMCRSGQGETGGNQNAATEAARSGREQQ